MAIFSLRGAARDYLSRQEAFVANFDDVLNLMDSKYSTIYDQIQLRNKLAELKHTGTIAAYNMEYDQLLLQIQPPLDNIEEMRLYSNGLKPTIRQAVLLGNPDSLDRSMRLATQVEESQRISGISRVYQPSSSSGGRPTSDRAAPQRAATTPTEGPKKLTPEEREQCRTNNQCFRCRKTGHRAQQCPLNLSGHLGKGQL